MKKTFELTHPKIQYARRVDAVKSEIRKYVRRERKKVLPENVDFWDFDCKFGDTEADAAVVHLSEIDKCIDAVAAKELASFYVEILAKEGCRAKKSDGHAEGESDEAESKAPIELKVRAYKGFGSPNPEA